MDSANVSIAGLKNIALSIETVWTEYADEDVIDAAKEAVEAIMNLRSKIVSHL